MRVPRLLRTVTLLAALGIGLAGPLVAQQTAGARAPEARPVPAQAAPPAGAPTAPQAAAETDPQPDPRLADLRADVDILSGMVADLRVELVQSGQISGPSGGDFLARIGALESGLMRMIAQTETVQLRLDRVIADASNRVADIEFRLSELEGMDPASLPQPPALGEAGAREPEAPIAQETSFEQARRLMAGGDYRAALDLLETEAAALAFDPDRVQRAFLRGEALSVLGFIEAAAQAYLDAFSAAPDDALAPQALLRLGQTLGDMGAIVDACITLGEVGARYLGLEHAATLEAAAAARSAFECP